VTGSVRIKICGVKTPEDALAAVEAGADLIGINFVDGSKRQVDMKQALEICEALEGYDVERVALFRDAQWDKIDGILRRVPFERVQFHGSETEEEIEAIDLPTIKAIRGADQEAAETYPGSILLLDHPHQGGGQGQAWDWREAEDLIAHGHDVIIAGGLTPENVAEALADVGDKRRGGAGRRGRYSALGRRCGDGCRIRRRGCAQRPGKDAGLRRGSAS